MFSRAKLRRANFSFHAALAESAGDKNAGDIFELAVDAVLERFRIDQFQIDPAILARGRVGERFVNAFVSVLQIDVFADDRDLDLLLRADDALDELAPVRQVRRRRLELQQLANEFVEPFVVQHQRHLVNGVLDIARLDHRVRARRCRTSKASGALRRRADVRVRQISTCGCRPISRSLAMLCCVGFVFSSPAALM